MCLLIVLRKLFSDELAILLLLARMQSNPSMHLFLTLTVLTLPSSNIILVSCSSRLLLFFCFVLFVVGFRIHHRLSIQYGDLLPVSVSRKLLYPVAGGLLPVCGTRQRERLVRVIRVPLPL